MIKNKIVLILSAIIVILGGYASWYSFNRNQVIAHNKGCYMSRVPCDMVPRTIWEVITDSPSSVLPGYIPARFGPMNDVPCNQSATTTPCEIFAALPQTPPEPYVPPDIIKPIDEWTSTADTPIAFAGYSFLLPPGWHGSGYDKGGAGQHLLVQQDPNEKGFTVDCPPDGKGLEVATRLSVEERTFKNDGVSYALSLEKWTAPGNDPWFFIFVRKESNHDTLPTSCLARGDDDPNTAAAMSMLYRTWNIK
jgi:hypothetical protein